MLNKEPYFPIIQSSCGIKKMQDRLRLFLWKSLLVSGKVGEFLSSINDELLLCPLCEAGVETVKTKFLACHVMGAM